MESATQDKTNRGASWGSLPPDQAERVAGQLMGMASRLSSHGYKASETYARATRALGWTAEDFEKIGHPVGRGFISDTMAYDRVCVDMERMGFLSGDGTGCYKTLPAGAALAAKWEPTLPELPPIEPPAPGMIHKLASWLDGRRAMKAEAPAPAAPPRPGQKP